MTIITKIQSHLYHLSRPSKLLTDGNGTTDMKRNMEKLLFFFTAVTMFAFFADVRYLSVRRSLLDQRHQLSKFLHTSDFENRIDLAISENNRRFHRMTTARTSLLFPLAGLLLPDLQALLLFDSSLDDRYYYRDDSISLTCVFQGGASSPAVFAGLLTPSNRPTFKCAVPKSIQKKNPTGRLHLTKPVLVDKRRPPEQVRGWRMDEILLSWDLLVYESFSTVEDVVVFAKGVNNRQNKNRPPSDLSCIFRSGSDSVTTAVTSSAQEVFRCHHPEASSFPIHPKQPIAVSLQITNDNPIPSVAQYNPQLQKSSPSEKSLTCACTMVRNVGKFLPEWVTYHSSIGVNKFFFYDNGSDDELKEVINTTVTNNPKKIHITIYHWPWVKTQEAGFSHCAVAHRETCKWMMFLDLDEFVFMPSWGDSTKPSPTMLSTILPTNDDSVGQLMIPCHDYGPSGQTQHPSSGVMHGYTCRRNVEERHKSIVRLDGVDDSLKNVVHHFTLKQGYVGRRLRSWEVVVNHYKYQAWVEFRNKFRQRVSAYVSDWTTETNPNSKDRTPGLGFQPIEPEDWTHRFCDVNDTRLRDVSWRWFHRVRPDGFRAMAWDFGRVNLQSFGI